MKSRRHEYWVLIFALLLSFYWMPETSSGLTLQKDTMESMTRKAHLVIVGKVAKIEGRWSNDHTTIYTNVDIVISDVLKGNISSDIVTLRMDGGRVGDEIIYTWAGVPFEINEEVIVYLYKNKEKDKNSKKEEDFYSLTSFCQSKFSIQDGRVKGSSLSKKDIAQQIGEFLSGKRRNFEGVDVPATCPSQPGEPFGTVYLSGQFAGNNIYWTKQTTPDTFEVVFKYNDKWSPFPTSDSIAIINQIQLAFDEWNKVHGCYIDFRWDANKRTLTDSMDTSVGTPNVIVWADNPPGNGDAFTRTNPTRFGSGAIQNADILLDVTGTTWSVGDPITGLDVRAILTHELGHAFGMGHCTLNNNVNTMECVIASYQSAARSVEAGDKAGAVHQATDNISGDLQTTYGFDMVWSALGSVTLSGNVTIPSGRILQTRSGRTINMSGFSIKETGGTFTSDAGTTWNPDIFVEAGTTLKGHYPTIQSAINGASATQTVKVGAGNYNEGLTLLSDISVVEKSSGAAVTVTYGSGPAATASGKTNITLNGIDLTGATFGLYINTNSSNITVKNATIKQTTAGTGNACIKIAASSTGLLLDSLTLNATATNTKGLYLDDADPVVQHANITNNDYGVYGINTSIPVLDPSNVEDYKNNNINNNTSYNAFFYSTGFIDAEHVWWGASPPDGSKIFHSGGLIDYDPWRSAPVPKLVALQQTPTDEEAAHTLNVQGSSLAQSGDYTGARTIFEQVMRDYPNTQEARLAVKLAANTYNVQGKFAEAVQYLDGLTWITQPELKVRVQYVALRYLASLRVYDNLDQRADALVAASPSSYYAPHALLDKGIVQLYGRLDTVAARATFQSIVDQYPISDATPAALAHLSITGQPPAKPSSQPSSFSLVGNAPNPFNPQTTIFFTLPQPTFVKLTIYNTLGQPVRQLVQTLLPSGAHAIVWDGHDDQGKEMASGVYLYRLVTPTYTESRKMTLVR